MAAVVNDRDVLIMAAVPRYTVANDRGMFVTPSTAVFQLLGSGTISTPGSFTFQATQLNLPGTVTWSWTGGMSPVVKGNQLTLDYASFSAVSGTITASITVDGETYTQIVHVSKLAQGTPGMQGQRGNVDISVATAGSIWSDSEAAAGLAAAGYGAPQLRDLVNLYKADRTFSAQRMYDGAKWVVVDYVYNGSVFVKGSILPESIDTRGLTIKDAAGNVIFGSGVNLDKSRINANFGTNLLYNGDFSNGLDGWQFSHSNGPIMATSGINIGSDWWLSSTPNRPGSNVMFTLQNSGPRSASYDDSSLYYEFSGPKVAVEVGKKYILSAYSGAHRCGINLFFYWLNAAGSIIAASSRAGASGGFSSNQQEATGGTALAGYKRIYDLGVAPAGATHCWPVLRKFATVAWETDSYSFLTRVMLEEVPDGVNTPGPWSPGQSVTQITPDNVSTYIQAAAIGLAQINRASIGSLSALSAFIGVLSNRVNGTGAGFERTNAADKVYDTNNVKRVQIGDLNA